MSDEPQHAGDTLAAHMEKVRARWLARWGPEGPPDVDPVLDDWDPRERQWEDAIPYRFRNARVGDFDPPIAASLAEWAANPDRNMVLLGTVGVGKTHAACATARVLFDEGRRVVFASLVEMLDRLRPDGGDRIERYNTAPVLILDDLGGEVSSDWTQERIYELVNYRYMHALPTIVTTNMDRAGLVETLDARIYSRLVTGSFGRVLSGPDQRKTKR